jgi:hypothetical protein
MLFTYISLSHVPANSRAVRNVLKLEIILPEGGPPVTGEIELSGFKVEPRSWGEVKDNIQRMIAGKSLGRVIVPKDKLK